MNIIKEQILLIFIFVQKLIEYYFQFNTYSKNPPIWAQDSFNNNEAYQCGYCESWMTVVRPGKVQCDTCGDGFDTRWIDYIKNRKNKL